MYVQAQARYACMKYTCDQGYTLIKVRDDNLEADNHLTFSSATPLIVDNSPLKSFHCC